MFLALHGQTEWNRDGRVQGQLDSPLTEHEGCGGHVERLLSAPAFQLKGTGWYATDYAKSGAKDADSSETKPAESKPSDSKVSDSKSTETKTESKATESKSESKSESKPPVTTKSD